MRAQYATPAGLQTRSSIWRADPEQGSPKDAAQAAALAAAPHQVLEIGCGTGEFAARLASAAPAARVLATDQSVGMVQASAERGLAAQVADAGRLPFADGSFDVVCALWMLYHVPDLAQTVREVRRVLRPGGTFVAATNGLGHTADLRALVGLAPTRTQFMTENAHAELSPYFAEVSVQQFAPVAQLDHAAAFAYLSSFAPDAAATLAPFDGERTFHGASCVLTCR